MAELPPDLHRAARWNDRIMIACLCLLSFVAGMVCGGMLVLAKLMGS